MQADNLDGIGLLPKDLLAGLLRLHDRLFNLDLFLEQILDLLDIVYVVLVDEKLASISLRPLFLLIHLLD